MVMWKPVRNEDKEAIQLIAFYASKGLQKELDKQNKKIKIKSKQLFESTIETTSIKKRSRLRTELDLMCQQRDRLEKAIQLCKEL